MHLFSAANDAPKPSVDDADKNKSSQASKWEVNIGPLAFGNKGIELKPQLKIGAETENFMAGVGMSDVRNGLKFEAKAEASVQVHATGHSVKELHDNIHCKTVGFREALEIAKELLSTGASKTKSAVGQIAETLGISREALEASLEGEGTDASTSDTRPMELVVKAEMGVGVGAEVCLGWSNLEGYRMVGVGGQFSAALSISVNVFAGKHVSGKSMKVILGISNFRFDYTFPLDLQNVQELIKSKVGRNQPSSTDAVDVSKPSEAETKPAPNVDLVGNLVETGN